MNAFKYTFKYIYISTNGKVRGKQTDRKIGMGIYDRRYKYTL